jgi:acyl carrier protein
MGLDSVELVMALEEDFQIEVSASIAETFVTVRDMRDFITAELTRLGKANDPDAIFVRLREIIVRQSGVAQARVELDSEIVRDLGID